MNDEKIFKMALIFSIIGIVGMIVFAGQISPYKVKINEINQATMDKEVTVECYVEEVKKALKSDTYFLKVNDGTGKMTVVIFEGTTHEMQKIGFSPLNTDKIRIRVTGTVTQYNGAFELILKDQNSIKIL
jgi:DNA/RNA endonuclease YhcR with UshA esterase domain